MAGNSLKKTFDTITTAIDEQINWKVITFGGAVGIRTPDLRAASATL